MTIKLATASPRAETTIQTESGHAPNTHLSEYNKVGIKISAFEEDFKHTFEDVGDLSFLTISKLDRAESE